jgi:hypothetical protein
VAVLLGVLRQVVKGVSCVDEGFAWDASPNQAGASGSFAFHDDGLQAELSRTNRSNVATGASADDEDLTILGLHARHLT